MPLSKHKKSRFPDPARIAGLLVLVLWSLAPLTPLFSQTEGGNPFELVFRVGGEKTEMSVEEAPGPVEQEDVQEEETPLPIEQEEEVDEAIEADPANPFEMIRSGQPKAKKVSASPPAVDPKPGAREAATEGLRPGKRRAASEKDELKSFLFWVSTGFLVYLAISITLFRFFLARMYRAFSNDNFLKLLHRELKGGVQYPYWMFYFFFFMNAGLFGFLISRHYGVLEEYSDPYLLLLCFAGVVFAFFAKQGLLKFLAWTFPIRQVLDYYNFTITVFSAMLGLVLFPVNIFIAFAADPIPQVAIYTGLSIMGLIYLYRYIRSIFSAGRLIIFHRFHFFVYLCSVEIAPALLIAKIIMNQAGI
jgi:hypothetical protein